MKKAIVNTLVLVSFICGMTEVLAQELNNEHEPATNTQMQPTSSPAPQESSSSFPINQSLTNSTDEIEDMD